ncbi:glycerate kinase [Agromyces atrinae]|uniref:Glycerate kinase n=1 Tax=Agromyces atrinae TaxID=592376 RepID=A0A4Q2M081_9MICO|nr:glycerate kinase [Agromyces atrinae]NYD67024.1 glycerate kinase [Agromyces atrinae]RXZ85245.1 glycerate kinase [Agromyces atrinae]RXZ85353.1 glycerate kinase [Agromyces atrinae]
MRIVIAPDSFKGTIDAPDVARALAAGWASVRPDDEIVLAPMADGGEGTLEAFEAAVPGSRRMPVTVQGPDSRPVDTYWLLLPGDGAGTAVVELAATSGITLLDPLQPLDAHSIGFGEAIADALDHGVDRLLLAIGGSASTDGGAGALTALGARFTDAAGEPIASGGAALANIADIDLSELRALPAGGAIVLSDVTNPLLGDLGAAAVFGPQKGATAEHISQLDTALAHFAAVTGGDHAAPGAGAAGGAGFGLLVWGASMGGGARAVAEAIALPESVAGAEAVITGEGRFDGQSAAGKVPSEVLRLAEEKGIAAFLAAGGIDRDAVAAADDSGDTDPSAIAGFAASVALVDLAGGVPAAMDDPARWLHAAGERLAASFGSR